MVGTINTLLVEDNPGDAALFREVLLTASGADFRVHSGHLPARLAEDALRRNVKHFPTHLGQVPQPLGR